MAKLKQLFSAFFVLTQCSSFAQSYQVQYIGYDSVQVQVTGLQTSFPTRNEASIYIVRLPSFLQSKGYITASVDSLQLDSTEAKVHLFLGEKYKWTKISTSPQTAALLEAIHWNEKTVSGPVDFNTLQAWQKKMLDHLEETGYPFGKVYLDSIDLNKEGVTAVLKN